MSYCVSMPGNPTTTPSIKVGGNLPKTIQKAVTIPGWPNSPINLFYNLTGIQKGTNEGHFCFFAILAARSRAAASDCAGE